MSKGISVHIGLNSFDPAHYGNSGDLSACESDANDMRDVARASGFEESTVLLTSQATTGAVSETMLRCADQLQPGDLLFLSYSGHGGFLPDSNQDEFDGRDETWCLYDRQLIDDELFDLYSRFQPGVRIFILSDSCHSGTVAKFLKDLDMVKDDERVHRHLPECAEEISNRGIGAIKAISVEQARSVYKQHKDLYTDVQKKYPKGNRTVVNASGILISGCQDTQVSLDGQRNGLFTGVLREVWNNGRFDGDYPAFHTEIDRQVRTWAPDQHPNYFKIGVPNLAFEGQKPFHI